MEIKSSREAHPPSIIEDKSLHKTIKRYKVCNHLGKGGFAAVYRVQSLDTNRIYAIKIINKSKLSSKEHRRKLVSEIKLHQSIQHRHVVTFERYFEDKKNVYILLECCSNGSLMSLHLRRKKITEYEVRYLMNELLEGLKYLHSKSIIHRDLKLGNILLDDKLSIKICDFGLAARLSFDSERKTTICGTPNYTAPEILNQRKSGEGHSYEVDIWSVGVIMFTLLTGKPPFETQNVKETYRRIKKIKYQFPPDSHSYISKEAKLLISSIFTKDPAQRPNLMQISNHSFFQLPTPKSLPLTILTQNPSYQDLFGAQPIADSTHNHRVADNHDNDVDLDANHNQLSTRPPLLSTGWRANHQYAGHQYVNPVKNEDLMIAAKSRNSEQVHNERGKVASLKDNGNGNGNGNGNVLSSLHSQNQKVAVHAKGMQIANGGSKMAEKHGENKCAAQREKNEHFVTERKDQSDEGPLDELENAENVKLSEEDRSKLSLSVIKHVDYRKKYGLGYILSNGCTGIYFNDSTKILLFENKRNAMYVDMYSHVQYLSLDTYPAELKKKVTLLKHFADYLWKPSSANHSGKHESNEAEINRLLSELQLRVKSECNEKHDEQSRVYLKAAFSDQYCMLFKLSNNVVQVNFTDSSQIVVLSSVIQYRDKNGNKGVYPVSTLNGCTKKDLRKRCKYTQQLLQSMASRKRKSE